MRRLKPGDTLIEVLFAFVILATITGFAFTGAMQAYKVSVNAQERTQATLVAQYEADGLKTYRDSINWKHVGLVDLSASFLDGGGFDLTQPALIDMKQFLNTGTSFCIKAQPPVNTGPQVWNIVQKTPLQCGADLASLAPNLKDMQVGIVLKSATTSYPDQVEAVVTVSWTTQNSTALQTVTNTINLTEQQ